MGFSRQEHWSGLPFPSPGDLLHPGIRPGSSALKGGSLPSEPPGKPWYVIGKLRKWKLGTDLKKGQKNPFSSHLFKPLLLLTIQLLSLKMHRWWQVVLALVKFIVYFSQRMWNITLILSKTQNQTQQPWHKITRNGYGACYLWFCMVFI